MTRFTDLLGMMDLKAQVEIHAHPGEYLQRAVQTKPQLRSWRSFSHILHLGPRPKREVQRRWSRPADVSDIREIWRRVDSHFRLRAIGRSWTA